MQIAYYIVEYVQHRIPLQRAFEPAKAKAHYQSEISETVLKLILPLLGDALLPCHSERSAAESKNLLPTQVEKMLRLRSA